MAFRPWLDISVTWGEFWQMLTAGSRSQRLRFDLSGLRPRHQDCLKRSLVSCIVQSGSSAIVLQCKCDAFSYIIAHRERIYFLWKIIIISFCPPWFQLDIEIGYQMLTKFSSCWNPVFLNWPEMMIIKTVMRKLILMNLPDRHHK